MLRHRDGGMRRGQRALLGVRWWKQATRTKLLGDANVTPKLYGSQDSRAVCRVADEKVSRD